MSYTYTPGQGVTALVPSEPAGSEPMSVAAIAIRQIKAYLNDATVGPDARLDAAEAAVTALESSLTVTGVLPIGAMVHHAANEVTYADDLDPLGFIFCDGRELDRVTYAALFAVIGVTWGAGNNVNTFNVPDVRGRALVMVDAGKGVLRTNRLDPASPLVIAGNKTGAQWITLTELQIPEHRAYHNNAAGLVGLRDSGAGIGNLSNLAANPLVASTRTTNATGGSQQHNNVQPTALMPVYIKYK